MRGGGTQCRQACEYGGSFLPQRRRKSCAYMWGGSPTKSRTALNKLRLCTARFWQRRKNRRGQTRQGLPDRRDVGKDSRRRLAECQPKRHKARPRKQGEEPAPRPGDHRPLRTRSETKANQPKEGTYATRSGNSEAE